MKTQKKKGSSRKIGRSKRAKDLPTSLYSKGKITYEQYKKMKGLR